VFAAALRLAWRPRCARLPSMLVFISRYILGKVGVGGRFVCGMCAVCLSRVLLECVCLGVVPPGSNPTVDQARFTLATQCICLHGLTSLSDGRTDEDESPRICTYTRSRGLGAPMRLVYFNFSIS